MGKQRFSSNRAWRLLKLALLWARKGGVLKCKLMAELRHMPKYLKGHHKGSSMVRYGGERELSFDETPVLHLKMSRPASLRFIMQCIRPEVIDFDYDFGDDCGDYDDVGYGNYGARKSFLENNVNECGVDNVVDYDVNDDDDEGIDVKAEEFIANFYSQMKMQRLVSFQRRQNNNVTHGQ